MKPILFSALLLLAATSCNAQNDATQKKTTTTIITKAKTVADTNSLAYQFLHPNAAMKMKVNQIYDSLTNSQRAAQMIMIASSETLGFPYETYVKPLVKKGIAANVLFLKGTTTNFKKQETFLSTQKIDGLQPLYACDCEPTLMHYKFTDKAKMSPTSSLNTTALLQQSLDTINPILNDLNIDINFAPVVDNASNKSVINKRSFGTNNDSIVHYSNQFIRMSQKENIAATIKHFPGHGAVVGDTHKQSVWINGKFTELDNFKNVINQSNPLLVMVGHISIKNNPEGYNTENGRPATTSRKIVTDLLKNDLKYKGIITTDAMNMQASKNMPDADWESVKAGIDLVLMPMDATKLHSKIEKALAQNDAFSKELEVSIKKIILMKMIAGKYNP